MIEKFTLQIPSETVDEALVTKVLVSVDDTVRVDQPVLEIETAKATAELPSSVAGVIREIRVKEGDTIQVGQEIFLYETDPRTGSPAAEPKAPTSPADNSLSGRKRMTGPPL